MLGEVDQQIQLRDLHIRKKKAHSSSLTRQRGDVEDVKSDKTKAITEELIPKISFSDEQGR